MGCMTDSPHPRAAIYARISLDKKEEAGVKRQVHLCTKLAEADEAVIIPDGKFVDNNISAFSGSRRPEYERLLQTIEAGDIDTVYVYALDRLARRTKDTLTLFELCEHHGVKVKATRGYSIDSSDPTSRLVIVILGLIAEQESIDRAARIRSAYEDRARTGRPKTGGRRMFGYEADAVTIVPAEAEALQEAARVIVSGKTLREAARMINSRGLTTTLGAPMSAYTLRDLLLNPRANGKSTFNPTDPETGYRLVKDRQVVGRGSWPAIIDDELFAQVGAVLNDPSRRTAHVGAAPTKFLSGVLKCSCGAPMYHRTRARKGGRAHYYACKREVAGATHTSVTDDVDDFIEKVVFARMAKPDALDVLRVALCPDDSDETGDRLQELVARRAALLARREELEQHVVDGAMDTSAFVRLENKFSQQIEAVDVEVQELTMPTTADPILADIADAVDFPAWWVGASIEDQRRLVHLLMAIHITRGTPGAKSFEPERVKVVWKS